MEAESPSSHWQKVESATFEGEGSDAEALSKAGVKAVYYESPGTAHEWLSWRRSLYQFAPLLFTNPK